MAQHQNDFQDGFLTKKTLNKNIFNESGRLNRSNIIDA